MIIQCAPESNSRCMHLDKYFGLGSPVVPKVENTQGPIRLCAFLLAYPYSLGSTACKGEMSLSRLIVAGSGGRPFLSVIRRATNRNRRGDESMEGKRAALVISGLQPAVSLAALHGRTPGKALRPHRRQDPQNQQPSGSRPTLEAGDRLLAEARSSAATQSVTGVGPKPDRSCVETGNPIWWLAVRRILRSHRPDMGIQGDLGSREMLPALRLAGLTIQPVQRVPDGHRS